MYQSSTSHAKLKEDKSLSHQLGLSVQSNQAMKSFFASVVTFRGGWASSLAKFVAASSANVCRCKVDVPSDRLCTTTYFPSVGDGSEQI